MGARGPALNPRSRRSERRRLRGEAIPDPVDLGPPCECVPDPPPSLGEAGRRAWRECFARHWITPDDAGTVEEFAGLVDQHAAMVALVAREGPTRRQPIQTATGAIVGERLVAHPLVCEIRRAEVSLDRYRRALKLTPASRSQAGLRVASARQELERLRQERERLLDLRRRYAREAKERRDEPDPFRASIPINKLGAADRRLAKVHDRIAALEPGEAA